MPSPLVVSDRLFAQSEIPASADRLEPSSRAHLAQAFRRARFARRTGQRRLPSRPSRRPCARVRPDDLVTHRTPMSAGHLVDVIEIPANRRLAIRNSPDSETRDGVVRKSRREVREEPLARCPTSRLDASRGQIAPLRRLWRCGALDRIRTCGFLLRRQTLYPLSYKGTDGDYTLSWWKTEKQCKESPRS